MQSPRPVNSAVGRRFLFLGSMKSQTQYFFHVGPTARSRRVTLLGDATLADLHELVSTGSDNAKVQFRVADRNRPTNTTLNELDLAVGQTFDYCVGADIRKILVEGIDH
jgi:hypothetical protein